MSNISKTWIFGLIKEPRHFKILYMSIKFKSVSYLYGEAKRTFLRFPGVLLCAILASWILMELIESRATAEDYFLPFTLLLGLPLFLAMTLSRESKGWIGFKYQLMELGVGSALLAV